jgi:two-component system KDP operon response regulator KdpE
LRVYIGHLRQKIEQDPDDPRVVLTEPGIGYRIADIA